MIGNLCLIVLSFSTTFIFKQISMNVKRIHRFVGPVPIAQTQTEVTPAHAWKGLKFSKEVVRVSLKVDCNVGAKSMQF